MEKYKPRNKNAPYQFRDRAQVVVQTGNDKQHWFPIVISSLSLLITPILVAIISYNASQSGTNKDYVSLAVNILNSKSSTPENRKWASSLLARLSPVPFSTEAEKQLANGSGLVGGAIHFAPMYGPTHPLIKKTDAVTKPCLPVIGPTQKSWSDKDMENYINRISDAYSDCANRHQLALRMIDILQDTYKTNSELSIDFKPKSFPVYKFSDKN